MIPEPRPAVAKQWVEENLPKPVVKHKKRHKSKPNGTSAMIGVRETSPPLIKPIVTTRARRPVPQAIAREESKPIPSSTTSDDGSDFIAGAILGAAIASIVETDDRPATSSNDTSYESGGGGDFGGGGASGSWDTSSNSSPDSSSSDSGSSPSSD